MDICSFFYRSSDDFLSAFGFGCGCFLIEVESNFSTFNENETQVKLLSSTDYISAAASGNAAVVFTDLSVDACDAVVSRLKEALCSGETKLLFARVPFKDDESVEPHPFDQIEDIYYSIRLPFNESVFAALTHKHDPLAIFSDVPSEGVNNDGFAGDQLLVVATNESQMLELEKLKSTLLSMQLKKLQAERFHFEREVVLKESHVQNITDQLNSLRASFSWKVTKPLRAVKFVIKRVLLILSLCIALLRKWGPIYPLKRLVGIYADNGMKNGTLLLKQKLQSLLYPSGDLSATTLSSPKSYANWIDKFDSAKTVSAAQLFSDSEASGTSPLISVVMPCYNPDSTFLSEAIESVLGQSYPHWELCIADDKSTDPAVKTMLDAYAERDARIKLVYREENGHISACTNSAIALATGDYIGLLDNDDVLHRDALYWMANEIRDYPEACLIYSDEDKLNEQGERIDPYFKSDFNYDLFLAQNMICHFGVYKADVVNQVGGFRLGLEGAQDWDLALRVIEVGGADNVRHIPRILYHWRMSPTSTASNLDAKNYAIDAQVRAVKDHLLREGYSEDDVSVAGSVVGIRVDYPLPEEQPLVSIIVPTKNALDLMVMCIESIQCKTLYKNYEIIVVDNNSDEKEALEYFDKLPSLYSNVRVIRDTGPFNYSAINNRAVECAKGELICLLNNDIEIISPNWLGEMVSLALRPKTGCVGAKLYYPNDTVQHAGVVLGIGGVAGHIHKHIHRLENGYFSRAALRQQLTAVTAACLVVRKTIFDEVGGLDEEHLTVAFNDVDFCLKVHHAGYQNVWTPYAECYHHESVSRGAENTPEKIRRFNRESGVMKRRWKRILANDPFFNPNCSLEVERFELAYPPRLSKEN